MKLSRTVDYALRATMLLAQEETLQPIPCSQLAKQGDMPERFLLQILRSLVTHGILRSTRGVDGGYTMVRSPSDISLLEIIEAIEGPVGVPEDDDGYNNEPGLSNDRLHHALQEVAESMRRQLSTIKIAHLLAKPVNNN
jgi:Rrf2 family protein